MKHQRNARRKSVQAKSVAFSQNQPTVGQMKFNEGDLVRVRKLKNQYWAGTWRVSSVMDRPPLAYIRQVDGPGKGYIEQKNLETIERAKRNEQLSIFE